MILRTPPQKKRLALDPSSPVSDRRVVVYNDPDPVSSLDPSEQMVCTYHCRQMVKSEFMVALDTAEKQVAEYQSKLETMNNELTKSEEQQQKCQAHLLFVEQELEASKGREQALRERILKQVNDSQERYITQLKHCSELEVQLKKEIELRKKVESLATSANERVLELQGKLTRLSESTGKEKTHLKEELSHLQDESAFSISRIKVELERMRLRAENSEKEAMLLEEQLGDLRDQLNECLHQKNDLEQKLCSSSASSHDVNLSENQTLVKHLQEGLRSYRNEGTGTERDPIDFFSDTRCKDDVWASQAAEETHAEMEELRQRDTQEDGVQAMPSAQIVENVLGFRLGYVKGLCHGSKPTCSSSTMHSTGRTSMDNEIQRKLDELAAKNEELAAKNEELAAKREELVAKSMRCEHQISELYTFLGTICAQQGWDAPPFIMGTGPGTTSSQPHDPSSHQPSGL